MIPVTLLNTPHGHTTSWSRSRTAQTEDHAKSTTTRLLQELADQPNADQRDRIREEVVLLNMAVAESIAGKYQQRGIELDDLIQVARLGLVLAVQRFDPDNGNHFLAFAVPTITGEVKRYFRDHGWVVRPTRRIQEVQNALTSCAPVLAQKLGRSPTSSELAKETDIDERDVDEALACEDYFRPVSLDMPTHADQSSPSVVDGLGDEDWQLDWVEKHQVLESVLAARSDDEQLMLRLRFQHGWTQIQIAAVFGVSQMQISRRLGTLFANLRDDLADAGATAEALSPTR